MSIFSLYSFYNRFVDHDHPVAFTGSDGYCAYMSVDSRCLVAVAKRSRSLWRLLCRKQRYLYVALLGYAWAKRDRLAAMGDRCVDDILDNDPLHRMIGAFVERVARCANSFFLRLGRCLDRFGAQLLFSLLFLMLVFWREL